MIAVIGATGNTGRAVVKELQALGEQPVCVVRNADKAKEILGPNARLAVAELTDRSALDKALAGVTSVFVVTGHNPQMAEQQINVQHAAEAAGAKYLVRVSGGRAVVGPNVESVVGRGHHAIEESLKTSKLGWVILRPGLFMQNALTQAASIKTDGKIIMPYPKDQRVALTDVRDTGAVGARILKDPEKHAGKTYEYTGAATTYGEFTDVMSQVLGKPITFVSTTIEQAEQAMRARQMPDWLITHALFIARTAANGGFDNENMKPIREIVGREPISARQFVQDYKAAFV
ncbi:MAG TPA: NmrA family NAD(P)-binding protein [Xanthobacteraceae bacterium]|nr:NmrA family NAD(P)-binding protein [Xanthobacteraceae bacterium]